MMTLTDFKYCFLGSLTITEFVLLLLVILEDYGMLNTYFYEMLNKMLKKLHRSSWWPIMFPPLQIFCCRDWNTYSW